MRIGKHIRVWWAALLLGSICGELAAQERHLVISQSEYYAPASFDVTSPLGDSASVAAYLAGLRLELIEEGYLAASFDSIIWRSDTAFAQLSQGEQYKWANLRRGNVQEEILSRIRYREKFFNEKPFKPKDMSRMIEALLDYADMSGYPFAEVGLDSIVVTNDQISAALLMHMNTYTVIDSIIIKGELNANRRVIENHLGLNKHMPYNQRQLDRIPNRLRELPYIKVIKPYEIGMREGKADVYLYLDNKKASNFDGVLGVLPDPETGEVTITGDVQLDLLNALRRGEAINMRWQRLQTRTQQLDLRLNYPFMFNTRLGVEFRMNLFRQDTLFSQVNIHGGLQYYFNRGNHIQVFVEDMQANVISPTAFVGGQFVDSRTTLFGIGGRANTLDYRFNPRSGYLLEGQVGAGIKRIQENPLLGEDFFDNISPRSELYNANFTGSYFQPIGKRSTVLFRLRSGYFLNENMFLNEAYRIGGLKTIRGFDEQAIFATGYAIGTVEFRYLLEENSNLFIFVDQGIYENRVNQQFVSDAPFGFGGGINFETGAGVFSLTYALGSQFGNQIQLRGGKLHFGFVSFF